MNDIAQHSVLIVEDDLACLAHFADAVRSSPELRLVGAVGTCAAALELIEALPDVLLTDLQLPDGHGLDVLRRARVRSPSTQTLVISVFADEATVVECVKAGASGYLLKDGTPTEIAASVLELVRGGSPLSASVARYVLRCVQHVGTESSVPPARVVGSDVPKRAVPNLTDREIAVLELLAKGFSPPEIGALLKISKHTVITHSRSIHRKLEVSSRSQAVYEALNLGLIRLDE